MTAVADATVRRFRLHIPESDLADLHRRLTDTRWPDDLRYRLVSRCAGDLPEGPGRVLA
jgi:hypothetical protein